MVPKITFFFAWYDFWIGFYYDRDEQTLYFCPLPCCTFKIQRSAYFELGQLQMSITASLHLGHGFWPSERYVVFEYWFFGPIKVWKRIYPTRAIRSRRL